MPTEAELLEAIYADPAADEPRAVYADFLSERSHPLGELITLQLARAAGRRGNKRREQALLDQHGHTFWPGHPGVFAGYVPALQFLDRGFPCRAFNVWFTDMGERVASAVGAPGWATVKTASVGDWEVRLVRRLLLGAPMPILEVIEDLPPAALLAIDDEAWAGFRRLREIRLSGRLEEIHAAVAALGPGLRARLLRVPPVVVGDRGSVSLKLRTLPAPKGKKAGVKAAKGAVKGAAKGPARGPAAPPRAATPPAAFWEELLASEAGSDARRHLDATADKTLDRLAPDLPAGLVGRVFAHYVAERAYVLWKGLGRIHEGHVEPLLRALGEAEPSFEGLVVAAAHRAGGVEGVRAAGAFFAFIGKSTNLPGLYKRLPELSATKALVDGMEGALSGFDTEETYGVPILPFYAAVFVVARARPRSTVWAGVEEKCERWGDGDTLGRARRAARG